MAPEFTILKSLWLEHSLYMYSYISVIIFMSTLGDQSKEELQKILLSLQSSVIYTILSCQLKAEQDFMCSIEVQVIMFYSEFIFMSISSSSILAGQYISKTLTKPFSYQLCFIFSCKMSPGNDWQDSILGIKPWVSFTYWKTSVPVMISTNSFRLE